MVEARDNGGRIARSWRLLRTSWGLVWRDAGLRRIALVNGLVSCGVGLALFALIAALIAQGQGFWVLVASIGLLYPATFLNVFLGVALVGAANQVIEGREPSLADGFALARARIRDIAGWALLATGVGVFLDQVVQRIPGVGRFARLALGAAWAIVTLFAVPIIALEGCGARECVKRSASIFRSRWGEGLVGSISIGAVLVVVTLPAALLLGAGLPLLRTDGGTGAVALVAAAAAMLTVTAYAGVVMRDLYSLALYRYATAGAVVGGFREQDLVGGLKLKPAGLEAVRRLAEPSLASESDTAASRIRRNAVRWCWICVLAQIAVVCTVGPTDPPEAVKAAAGVLMLAGTPGLLVASGYGTWRLRSGRPRPVVLWVALGGALAGMTSWTWAVIGHEGNAYVAPFVIGVIVTLIALSTSAVRRLIRRVVV
jgi:hypothetical protein